MKKLYAGAAVLVLTAGIGGIWIYTRGVASGEFDPCRAGAVAGAGDLGGPFTLVSETGETMTEAEVLDRPALVYFGYTFCPDVCPLDTVRNADAVELLNDQGHDIRSVMITVDPKRDTPEAMADFTANIQDSMLGLTGSPEQVKAAADAYRVYYKSHDDGTDDFYLVDHSTFTYLVLPETGFVEFFRRDTSAEEVAKTAACYLERA